MKYVAWLERAQLILLIIRTFVCKFGRVDIACVASVSVQFGSKELQGDEWSE